MNKDSIPQGSIYCEGILYRRLQSISTQEKVFISLFILQLKSKSAAPSQFLLLDFIKTKQKCQSQVQKLAFNWTDFNTWAEKQQNQTKKVVQLVVENTKEQFQLLIGSQNDQKQGSKKIQLINVSESKQLSQINKRLKNSCIICLNFPSNMFSEQNKQTTAHWTGIKFNPKGRLHQGWIYLQNGKAAKFLGNTKSISEQTKKTMISQDKTYQKNQLKQIISHIKAVHTLQQPTKQTEGIVKNMEVLGQNFHHSQKWINNPNSILPILSYQINLMCYLEVNNHKNKNSRSPIKPKPYYQSRVNVFVNLDQCTESNEKSVLKTILSVFQSMNKSSSSDQINNRAVVQHIRFPGPPTKLCNPHIFLKIQPKQKFSQYFTKGVYEYYHYGDQNFNDQGWGCAYRSLQTLLSWFRLQHRLNILAIPTIREIQNMIDLIDYSSENKLSNTNTWIGATQVSWIVKKLTGYDCRILHIKDGKDIVEQAEMFRQHLQRVGSPIMYGGDQYAYSIVGIDYNWKLGEVMFLILDPHYNGSDKIDKMIEKKGVCWRKPEQMFKKGVFYNFCMPIVPI